MGVKWLPSLVLLVNVIAVCALTRAALADERDTNTDGLCHTPGCNCTTTGKVWVAINCTLNATKKLRIIPNCVPRKTMEIAVVGGKEVIFEPHVFSGFGGFHLLRIDGTKQVEIKKNAFFNLNSASMLLQIQNCNSFHIESQAFKDTQAPISVEVSNCEYVTIEGRSFGRLQDGKFHNISHLNLGEEAFRFENQKILSHHGPASTLSFVNVKIPVIPPKTFSSALAELVFQETEIEYISPEALSATQISSIIVMGCNIRKIRTGAFNFKTQVFNFKFSKTRIATIENNAFMNPFTNFTVEFSSITEIKSHAVSSVVVQALIADNEIGEFYPEGFEFKDADKLNFDNNIIRRTHNSFLKLSPGPSFEFSFVHNEITEVAPGSLSFISKLIDLPLRFDDNLFSEACRCDISEIIKDWLGNTTQDVNFIMETSFCKVDDLLGRCFDINGLVNMANFTELVCKDYIRCEKYRGETVTTSNTTNLLTEDVRGSRKTFIIGMLVLSSIVMLVTSSFVIIVVVMKCWTVSCLKRSKNYVQRLQYLEDVVYTEEEELAASPPTPHKEPSLKSRDSIEIPTELTAEVLEQLRVQLDNPDTYDEASQIILRMCQEFAPEDIEKVYDDAHLYEELSHLSNIRPGKNPLLSDKLELSGLLKYADKKHPIRSSAALAEDYAEPKDTTVHLYSELNQRTWDEHADTIKSNTSGSKSNISGTMTFRPLPARPMEDACHEAGPSRRH